MYLSELFAMIEDKFKVFLASDDETPIMEYCGFGDFEIPEEYKNYKVKSFYSVVVYPTGSYSSDDYSSETHIILDDSGWG